MKDFLMFRRMITPLIIQIVFWLGVVGCVIGGFLMIIGALMSASRAGAETTVIGILVGLGVMIVGPVAHRIYCELLILFFRMNETLSDIRDNQMSVPGGR